MNIRTANINDIDSIINIANDAILTGDNIDNGFLVSGYTRKEYEYFINNYITFKVIENEIEILGFIMVIHKQELRDEGIINNMLLKEYKYDFMVVKQICIDKKARRTGLGAKLYDNILAEYNKPIFAAVVSKPMNEVSMGFHKEMGFKVICNITPEDNMERAIVLK